MRLPSIPDGSAALAPARASAIVAVTGTSGQNWRDLGVRAASAALLAPLFLGALWLGGTLWSAIVALATVGLLREFMVVSRHEDPPYLPWPVRLVLGLAYVLPAALSLVWLRADPAAGRANVLFVVLLVWASDVGAYLVGRLVGGPRLAPRISPGKTWSGAVGGLASAVAVGLTAAVILPGASFAWAALVGALLGLVAQAGDLMESALKRHYGVKDSGHIIPGHGGLLDRLDALLLAAPAAALVVIWNGPGSLLWQ